MAARAQSVRSPDPYVSALLNELPSTSYHRGVDPLELLNHFFQTTDPLWMGSAECQRILQQYTPQLALESSFLLHAMLAFSAYHIAASCSEQQRYKMAAACHYSAALQSYRRAINDESVKADALFACCMLLTLLSFKNLSSDQSNDDVSISQKSFALDTVGIRFIGGPRILADAISQQSMIDQGIWKSLFRHCAERVVDCDDTVASSLSTSQAMAGLEAVCLNGEINGPYETALASLRQLMQCYISERHKMVEFTFCFAIQLDPRFLRLIEEAVPKALLVICYWYALVMQVDQWWASRTAQVEGIKLLRYLRDNVTRDSALKALLDFPARLLNSQSSTTQAS